MEKHNYEQKGITPHVPEYDAFVAKAAFERIRKHLDAIPTEHTLTVNVDLQTAALAAIAVADDVNRPDVKKTFALLPKEVFSMSHLEALNTVGWATWYVRRELLASTIDDVKLPLVLLHRASDLKERMLKLCAYYFDDDPHLAREVVSIRAGSGYVNLATDLTRLAKLYNEQKHLISADRRHYRADDAYQAEDAAESIFRALGFLHGPNHALWANYQVRVWTMLDEVYNEVREAGLFLFRKQNPENRFPSLFVKRRSPAPVRAVSSELATEPGLEHEGLTPPTD